MGGFSVVFSFIGFGYLFAQNTKVFFWSGFFVGLFWFYWISFSFVHYDLAFLAPFVILGVCIAYGVMFLIPAKLSKNPWIRGVLFFLLTSFVHPFRFNWLDFRISFLDSVFGVDYLSFFCFLGASICAFTCKRYFKLLCVVFLLLSLDVKRAPLHVLPFNIELTQTDITQDDKWKSELTGKFINDDIAKIELAIKNKKRLIIMPESAFPLYLNRSENVNEFLKEKSFQIAIVAGALTYENGKFYNSTYVFDKGNMKILNKVVLVPFGEEIPLPNFMKRWINDIFYGGAEDFSTAVSPQDYTIDGIKIRNAICFEATAPIIYHDNPDIVIAISNNAWFTPSTEPLVQKLLLRLFATLHNTTIYHSVNGSKSEIIYPEKSGILPDFKWWAR